jgi:hypothetical protein
MEGLLLLAGLLLASASIGYALNRLILRKVTPGPMQEIALAASRAVFYAPSLVEFGHGAYIPAPLLLTLENSRRTFAPPIDVLTFLLPGVVFLGSLVWALSKTPRGKP